MSDKITILPRHGMRNRLNQFINLIAIFALIFAFTLMNNNFLVPSNLSSLLTDTAAMMLMAAGMTPILLLGSIDLSISGVCMVSNIIFVKYLLHFENITGMNGAIFLAYTLSIAFGFGAGLLLSMTHVKLKLPSFIASLGFMQIWKTVALMTSDTALAIPKRLQPSISWSSISFGVVGLPLVLAFVVVAIIYILQRYTAYGKAIFAIGNNERASRIAGIPVDKRKMTAFLINGVCSAIAGIFMSAKLKSSTSTMGDTFVLPVVASIVLGGTAITGGRGSVINTITGVFIICIIRNGMNIVGVDAFWQDIIFGLVVLCAVAFTTDRTSRSRIVK